ncbi:phosphotransferase family protein [Nocardia sp. NPDC048505]|uniref:phosphotransferase family protein n=1 Tax=unclassified Nocardia TaxID=2637762 RepID=UPI0033C3E838
MADEPDPTERMQLTVSGRDLDTLAEDLSRWLAGRVSADEPPKISGLSRPEGAGMSSTSVFFDAEWSSGGTPAGGSFVARLAPQDSDFPIFETYDLERQYQVIAGVAAASDVPVPVLRWLETDESVLGAAFFVMEKAEGRVVSDNPPYVFLGWVFEATPEEHARLLAGTVEAIAKIHDIPDPAAKFPMLDGPGPALRRTVDWYRGWYQWGLADDGYAIPIIERGFDWLEAHWPADPGPDVLSWGDSRPGNILYRGFDPAAVLDWEMATIGPRELDVAWLIFLHRFFQDLAVRFDQPGLPGFLPRAEVVAKYEELTGYTLRDLDFYIVFSALKHAIVMARVKRRMIHFGEDTDTPDRDDYVMHRPSLEALLDGTYQWD